MIIYLIRHKPTGYYLPDAKKVNAVSNSFVELDPNKDNARIMINASSAKSTLQQWLRGKQIQDNSGFVPNTNVIKQINRIKEDMEIISIEVEIP